MSVIEQNLKRHQITLSDQRLAELWLVARAENITLEELLTRIIDDYQLPAMRRCEDCGRLFVVRDGRQRFCNDNCAARTRYHQKAKKNREVAA